MRVIDYKTGRDDLDFRDVSSLFSRTGKINKAAFQTLMYALLYVKNNPGHSKVVPGLMNRKNLFDSEFNFGLLMDKKPLTDAVPLLPEFEMQLQALVNEIFDPAQVFDQTTHADVCKICAYSSICYR